MRITIFTVFIFYFFISCNKNENSISGNWRAELYLQNDTVPFNFTIVDTPSLKMYLINGEEKLLIEDIRIEKDSLVAGMHIFDTEIRASISNDQMTGVFEKNYSNEYVLGFSAKKGQTHRFTKNPITDKNISGKWEVQFESELEDSTKSVGQFIQKENRVYGTFLTETGDYRYLEGEMDGSMLKLSCFDGEHAFLFKAKLKNDSLMNGTFKSGKTWNETWTAIRNDSIQLNNSFDLTYLKDGYDSLHFAFPDMNGDTMRFPNPQLYGKVVLVQVFGTWCPNCMDETRFLAPWYEKNKDRGVEILAIAFERKNDLGYAAQRIQKVKDKLGADYTFLFGGPADKAFASESLPMLNEIISFPTLIFIDRKGNVRKIHTGFSGPGTGIHYLEFKKEFEFLTEKLIEEN